MADMFETIDTCPVPVIARVQGAALGGGMGLCAVGDLVIAESGARFGFTETRLGILPAVISPFVIAKIGETPRAGAVPGRPSVRCRPRPADRPRPRARRGRGGARRGGRRGRRRHARRGPDRRTRRQGDRPRGPRPVPWVGEVAHRPGHRPPAREPGGAGGVPAFAEKRRPAWTGRRRADGPERESATPGAGGPERRRANVAPRDLGRDFRWLWAASRSANLGDGALLAAGPLLVTTITREPIRGRRARCSSSSSRG